MGRDKNDVLKAKNLLTSQTFDLQEAVELAEKLKKKDQFGWARRLLDRAAREWESQDVPLDVQTRQLHSLCTYKDPDLPEEEKYDRAEKILGGTEALRTTRNQETLGLAGAIYKRRFEHDGDKSHLERSLAYYRRGYQVGPELDYGYTAINTAFVLDLLAHMEEETAREAGETSLSAQSRRDEAQRIRRTLTEILPGLPEGKDKDQAWLNETWWFLVTVAEAYFGLDRFDEAKEWLTRAKELKNTSKWEVESTARQLATLAWLRGDSTKEEATECLRALLGPENTAGVQSALAGKLGLALSGGGFRASLFHLGVLAKLAELDLLRHLHVLSCVSGGSIVGAHYQLEVKRLMESKSDEEITQQDYLELVGRTIRSFLAGVQTNVRTRVAANPLCGLRMMVSSTYSITERIGALFERQIYRRIENGSSNRAAKSGKKRPSMHELRIQPKGADDFHPKQDNWLRKNKVPILVLNATTLNTGHNWQFTNSWMGEPPGSIDSEIDGNPRLRRMYYGDAPERQRDLPLGLAVGASACVPGLFEPVALPGLFPKHTIRLVDGGVHDNQGITGLLEQGCQVILVSDASGQMNANRDPKAGAAGPVLRSNNILMSRVRYAQLQDLKARRRSSLLRGLMVVHLKKELDVDPLDWIGCEEPPTEPQRERDPRTSYGIHKDVQELLAGLRTDLDTFSELEAYALMTSGYLQTARFTEDISGFPRPAQGSSMDWPFLPLKELLAGPEPSATSEPERVSGMSAGPVAENRRGGKTKGGDPTEAPFDEALYHKVQRHLDVGSKGAFRLWKLLLPRWARWGLALLAGVAVLGALAWFLVGRPDQVGTPVQRASSSGEVSAGQISIWLIAITLVALFLVIQRIRGQTPTRFAVGAGLGLVGWIFAWFQLLVVDPLLLRLGRL